MITRDIFGTAATLAPKSLFTVFRVPLIDAICAAAIAVLYQRFLLACPKLSNFWLILLYTAAFKSLLQAFEIVSQPNVAGVFFYLTLVFVVAGIVTAFYVSRRHLSGFVRGLEKFSVIESLFLALLLIAYLRAAIVPSFVYP